MVPFTQTHDQAQVAEALRGFLPPEQLEALAAQLDKAARARRRRGKNTDDLQRLTTVVDAASRPPLTGVAAKLAQVGRTALQGLSRPLSADVAATAAGKPPADTSWVNMDGGPGGRRGRFVTVPGPVRTNWAPRDEPTVTAGDVAAVLASYFSPDELGELAVGVDTADAWRTLHNRRSVWGELGAIIRRALWPAESPIGRAAGPDVYRPQDEPDPAYADYVRIEIHAGGGSRVLELRPTDTGKVKAKLTAERTDLVDMPAGPVRPGGPVRYLLDVTGPESTMRLSKTTDPG